MTVVGSGADCRHNASLSGYEGGDTEPQRGAETCPRARSGAAAELASPLCDGSGTSGAGAFLLRHLGQDSSLLLSLAFALQAMQEKKALSWRGRGRLRGFLEIRTQTLLQVVLGPSSEEHAMAELRPVRHPGM